MYDVIVVGASVSGLRTADLISSEGYKVLVLEEHEKIGKPIKCAGLVSWRILELLPALPKEIIVNTVNEAKFFSPSGDFFTLKSKKPVYVIDREKLEEFLAKKALKNCEIRLSTVFKGLRYDKRCIKVLTNEGSFESRILVGADGANSSVAKFLGLKQPSKILFGLQATVKGNFEEGTVELWFGRKLAPNFFAWVIPESNKKARIGLATNEDPIYFFRKFLKKRTGKFVKPNVAGVLRLGLMKETVHERVLLVGDAACQVKPFSGGGIIYGMIASEICAEACKVALEKNKLDKKSLRSFYESVWKKRLAKPIKIGMLYRKVLSSLSDSQLDLLFASIKRFGIKFLENLDMDFLQ
jgi:geranylgeranyl reductase family protein